MSWIETVAQVGGIGAVFAIIMFWIYRHDRQESEKAQHEAHSFWENRLESLLTDYREDCRVHTEASAKLREALTELTTWLKRKNGS